MGVRIGRRSLTERRTIVALSAALLIGLQFQIVVPISSAGLKISPGDPIAVLMAAIALALAAREGRLSKPPYDAVLKAFALTGAALMVATAVAVHRLGYAPPWALTAKLPGWIVLFAYLVATLWSYGSLDSPGRRLWLRWMTVSIAGATFVAMVPFLLYGAGIHLAHFPLRGAFDGFVGNRNALSIFLIGALSVMLTERARTAPLFRPIAQVAILAIIGFGLIFAASRSGMPLAAALILLALVKSWIDFRVVAAASLIIAAYFIVNYVSGPTGGHAIMAIVFTPPIHESGMLDVSSEERWQSYGEAVRLWLHHPVFGIGLGAFLERWAAQHGTPLLIHNSSLWILTEMGLLGLAAFCLGGWLLLRPAFRGLAIIGPAREPDEDPDSHALRLSVLSFVAAFAVMSLVHELLYQRIAWVLVGLALAAAFRPDAAAHDRRVTSPRDAMQ